VRILPGFGNKLKYKRLAMGLSLKDAARKVKVNHKQLKALEEEEILSFAGKDRAADLLIKCASAFGLNQAELLSDLDLLWSDANTAKAYLQQRFQKQHRGRFFKDRRPAVYGAVAAAAVLFLSAGGYLCWIGAAGGGGTFVDLLASSADGDRQSGRVMEKGNSIKEAVPGEASLLPDEADPAEEFPADPVHHEEIDRERLLGMEAEEGLIPAIGGGSIISTPRTGGSRSISCIGLLILASALFFLRGRLVSGLPPPGIR
jgi:transcriptional regulator with XRE-family HTH domain